MMRRPAYIATGFVLLLTCGVQVEAACNSDATVFDCHTYDPLLCHRDSQLFCLTNGTYVTGLCEAKRAVCLEQAYLDNTNVACDPTATTAAPSHGNLLDCSCYNETGLCRQDLHVYCLTNGTTLRGSCNALKAVCHEHAQIDETEQLCPATEPGNLDCVSYNASGHCPRDNLAFCLNNGTTVYGTCTALKAICHEGAHIDQTGLLCPGQTTENACVIYNASSICNPDLRPYCLGNGTRIFGTCSALKAVCHEHATIDNTGHVCPGETNEDACVSYSASGHCPQDLRPFCLTNGTMVFGTCSALQAVCHEHASIDETGLLCPGKTTENACVSYNVSGHCTQDLTPYCLINGTRIFGTCSALKAVCHEHAQIDDSGHLCPGATTENACVSYNASGHCFNDLTPYCLTNGTKIFGSCSLLKAVCHEHAQIDDSGHLCPGATTENACVSYNASGHCFNDLTPYCLTNGTKIFGSCSLLKAVCHERATRSSCDANAATSLLISTYLLVILIAVCVSAWDIMK